MRIFLDANILVSLLNKEFPLFTYSSRLVSLTDNKNYSVFTSPVCLAIAFYFAEKKSGTLMAKSKIDLLASRLNITNIGENEVFQALRNERVKDFEDGMQYYAAKSHQCKIIITEDRNDFYFSDIKVMGAEEFLTNIVLKQR